MLLYDDGYCIETTEDIYSILKQAYGGEYVQFDMCEVCKDTS